MNKKLILLGSFIAMVFSANAQKAAGGYFSGTARALVESRTVLDTLGVKDGATTGGYTLFDLGINAVRNDVIKASAVLRVKNEFGGFFGDGVFFEFRQMRLEGLIGEVIKYQIGDLDLLQTEYTLYNNDIGFNKYESELFSMKRDIINYENFYTKDNTWRTQGVNLYTTFLFKKAIDKMKVRVHGNRVAGTNLAGTPDRFMYGGDIRFIRKNHEIGFHANNVQDLAKTLIKSAIDYDNQVYTGNFKLILPLAQDRFKIGFDGEAGISQMSMQRGDSTKTLEGGFADIGLVATYKPYGLKARVAYRMVDAHFTSPAAQTRRVYDYNNATRLFGYDQDNEISPFGINRVVASYDRLSQETGLYNSKTLSTSLMAYNPIYGNALPYGKATPNRAGLDINISLEDSTKIYDITLNTALLNEINPENADAIGKDLRNFFVVQAGAKINIHTLLGEQNTMAVSAGLSRETTTRSGNTAVDFATSSVDFGLDLEPYKRLHFLLGYKTIVAKGNEYIIGNTQHKTDEYNDYTLSATNTDIDTKDNIFTVGSKFIFSDNTFFAVQGNFSQYDGNEHLINNPTNNWKYNMNQVYFLYSQKF